MTDSNPFELNPEQRQLFGEYIMRQRNKGRTEMSMEEIDTVLEIIKITSGEPEREKKIDMGDDNRDIVDKLQGSYDLAMESCTSALSPFEYLIEAKKEILRLRELLAYYFTPGKIGAVAPSSFVADYERGYKDGESNAAADWTNALNEEYDIHVEGPKEFVKWAEDNLCRNIRED